MSYLFYADRLNQLPLGIVGIAVATTLLPLLSRYVQAGKKEEVTHYTSRAIEFCLMLGLPATVGLAVAAQPIIQTLFEHGEFHHSDAVATGYALAAYSFGIPAFLLVKVFSAVFFAHHNTTTPVRVAFIAMAVNVVASILFLKLFQHTGIALANSLAVWVNALFLYVNLRRHQKTHGVDRIGDAKLRQRAPRLLLSAIGMGLIAYALVQASAAFYATSPHLGPQVIVLTGIIGVSSLGYALLLHFTHAVRWSEVRLLLRRKNPVQNNAENSSKNPGSDASI